MMYRTIYILKNDVQYNYCYFLIFYLKLNMFLLKVLLLRLQYISYNY